VLKPVRIVQKESDDSPAIEITEFEITTLDKTKFSSLNDYFELHIKPTIAELDYKEKNLKVITEKASYWYDADKETIIEEAKGKQKPLGCGKIVIKASLKKTTKTKTAFIEITVELTPDYQKDYEIIPYSPYYEENQQRIDDFMVKYITKPFEYLDNVIGAEINFNKVFYQPEKLREIPEIVKDLQTLEDMLKNLENELAL
jgi:type I restriction enzyme M protein